MKATKEQLIGVGELERLAGAYESTAATLRKLAKGLRGVVQALPTTNSEVKPVGKAKKRKKLSAAQKKAISERMKARWAQKRKEAA